MNPVAWCGAALLILVQSVSLVASTKSRDGRETPVCSTFLRHSLDADVSRGGEVVIPVQAISLPGQAVDLLIEEPPRFGTLVPIWSDQSNRPALVYRNNAAKRTQQDNFVVRVRVEGRAWSTQRGRVQIHDHPAELKTSPGTLDFGELPSGMTGTQILSVSNASGNNAVGTIVVPSPWRIEDDPSFRIPEGSARSFRIAFTPRRPGEFSGALEFASDSGSWDRIPLRGRSLPPFLVAEDRCRATSGKPLVPIVLSNPSREPVHITSSPDAELIMPGSLDLPASGAATLTVDTSHAAVPLESSRILHATLQSEDYRKSVEITVDGREGCVTADIPPDCRDLRTSASNPVKLTARLVNESRFPKDVTWNLQGEGRLSEGQENGSFQMQGGETRDLSLFWMPGKVGRLSPSLSLSSGATVTWNVESFPARDPSALPSKSPISCDPLAIPSAGPRYPTDPERQRMVILSPPVLKGWFFPRSLILSWSYQGYPKTSFVIEEKGGISGLIDRTGESGGQWTPLSPKYVAEGERGVWAVRIPVYLPSVREFRIYPAGEGERVIASQTLTLDGDMVFGPLFKALALLAVIVLAFIFMRMLVTRVSRD